MVPPDSHRIPRVPRYSGFRYASYGFVYGPFTLCGASFQALPLAIFLAMSRPYNPRTAGTARVWALPRSLATTGGIIVYFLFLQVLRCFSSLRLPPTKGRIPVLQTGGLSHSEIRGSKVICTYPRLIAAYHVLHRLREPRHPPCALSYLSYLKLRPCGRTLGIYFQLVLKFVAVFNCCFCHIMSKIVIVENNGFEPLTPCLQSRCSSQLS